MTPAKEWNGRYNANGGIIIVKDQGDVVCIHFYDRNDLEDYLYTQTYFETPSMTRHKFGHIYKKDGNKYLKLNLQVRFS
ncbi:MAG: HpaII family restriction endonuclease [Paludibacteraceae bacterium]|nr:HpaII family restriction endonuclease [Paludibacteraceae bacterium]